ncbi:hypothetical protein B484DRAFT_396606, partial [Ochromonadaceae sp. CCMP2298]
MLGGCELSVNASKAVYIHDNSSITGSALQFTARSITIKGTLTTSHLGPLFGPGTPTEGLEGAGQGGTYGGSGGRIGSINIFDDLAAPPTSPAHLSTLGSGGGSSGGAGGGRIVLRSQGTVEISPLGVLASDGAPGTNGTGGGSGGAIAISGSQLLHRGLISAVGGGGVGAGAGGGGRVSVIIQSANLSMHEMLSAVVRVGGGGGQSICGAGGAGTAYVHIQVPVVRNVTANSPSDISTPDTSTYSSHTYSPYSSDTPYSPDTPYSSYSPQSGIDVGEDAYTGEADAQPEPRAPTSTLLLSNNNIPTFAITLLTLPPALTILSACDGAVLSTPSIHLQSMMGCGGKRGPLCSSLSLLNATLVVNDNASYSSGGISDNYSGNYDPSSENSVTLGGFGASGDSRDSDLGTVFPITADKVLLSGSSIVGVGPSSYSPYSLNITAHTLTVDSGSSVGYSRSFTATVDTASIQGQIVQLPAYPTTSSSSSFYPHATVALTATSNITVGDITASNIHISANHILILPDAQLSPLTSTHSCLENVTLASFSCFQQELLSNNTYTIVGNSSIGLGRGASLQAAQLLLCAPVVVLMKGTVVSADGRGCAANRGTGSGGAQADPSLPGDP